MDDMFGMLFNTLSPEKKLLTAVTNNMLDTVVRLIQDNGPVLLNAPLYQENRRIAMHLACKMGHEAVVQFLVSAGGDVNAMDLFGLTPLTLAMRHGKNKCAQLMLQNSTWHPGIIWQESDEHSNMPYWTSYSEIILCLMVIGTPNILIVENIGQFNFIIFVELCIRYEQLIKAFYLTGNRIPEIYMFQVYNNFPNLGQWVHEMLSVQTLKHYARIAVRRGLQTNVFYGTRKLDLPTSLQKYIIFEDEMPF